jgi:hypothetical protein
MPKAELSKDKSYARERFSPQVQPAQRDTAQREPAPAVQRIGERKPLAALPSGLAARQLRQSAMLQMQQDHGNAFVMRQLLDAPAEETAMPVEGTAEGSEPTEIVSGSSAVRTTPGGVQIEGGMVNVDSGMMRTSGIMQADTLIANTVVASAYTPGAGNVM